MDQGRRIVPNSDAQKLRCIFPANADPGIHSSNWRYAWKNCPLWRRAERQLGADCSTDRAREAVVPVPWLAVLLGEGEVQKQNSVT